MRKKWALLLLVVLLILPVRPALAEPRRNPLPERYLSDCPAHGEIHSLLFQGHREMQIWTPYDYDPQTKYDVVLLLHGDNDGVDSWLRTGHLVAGGVINGRSILDWLAYEHRCRPFLVVAIENQADRYGAAILEDVPEALAYAAERFSTYAQDGSREAVVEARAHFTVGGLSRGGVYAYALMQNRPEYAANYLCMSCGVNIDPLEEALKASEYPLGRYFAAVGVQDPRPNRSIFLRTCAYAQEAELAEYAYGHDWNTWMGGLYDGLLFLLPPTEGEQGGGE